MIKNDKWIKEMACNHQMIEPFCTTLIKEVDNKKVISYGLGSYGYDIRLSEKEFFVFDDKTVSLIDPKNFDKRILKRADLNTDRSNRYFVIPAYSYALGVALEKLNMPCNVTAIAIGKSTYARSGIILNMTPVEAGWKGFLTLEICNPTPIPCKLYTNEGIVQLIFFEGEKCEIDYSDRSGKYQNQSDEVVTAKV